MNAKKKGNLWENKLANWLIKNGIKAWKDGASGGGSNEKADVGNNLNLHIESKAVKGINLLKVWNKAEFECQKTHNEPVIFIHFDSMPDDEWLTVIHSEKWLDLTKNQKQDDDIPRAVYRDLETQNDRDKKYALLNLKSSISRFLKLIE